MYRGRYKYKYNWYSNKTKEEFLQLFIYCSFHYSLPYSVYSTLNARCIDTILAFWVLLSIYKVDWKLSCIVKCEMTTKTPKKYVYFLYVFPDFMITCLFFCKPGFHSVYYIGTMLRYVTVKTFFLDNSLYLTCIYVCIFTFAFW